MEKVVTRTAEISVDENGVIHIVILDRIRMDYLDALDNFLVIKNFIQNKKSLSLLDSRCRWSIDKKAREFIASKEIKERTIARAVLVNSTIKKVLSNFYLQLNEPEVPAKIFTDYTEAYNWLLIQGIKAGIYP